MRDAGWKKKEEKTKYTQNTWAAEETRVKQTLATLWKRSNFDYCYKMNACVERSAVYFSWIAYAYQFKINSLRFQIAHGSRDERRWQKAEPVQEINLNKNKTTKKKKTESHSLVDVANEMHRTKCIVCSFFFALSFPPSAYTTYILTRQRFTFD